MRPVFIGGCERSGTTLLGAMLGAHAECLTVPESQFKIDVLYSCAGTVAGEPEARCMEQAVRSHMRLKGWGLSLDGSCLSDPTSPDPYRQLMHALVVRYAERVGARAPSVWVDHTPNNLMHSATLLARFPDAKFIHIVRDGRAITASVLPLDWGPNTVTQAARWWSSKIGMGLASEAYLGAERVLRVHYETLIRDPESALRTICDFVGLDYQPAMRDGGGFVVPVYSRQQHRLVGHPPDPGRLDAWHSVLSTRQVEIFEYMTGDLLTLLGYARVTGFRARRPMYRERGWLGVVELVRRLANRVRLLRRRRLLEREAHR